MNNTELKAGDRVTLPAGCHSTDGEVLGIENNLIWVLDHDGSEVLEANIKNVILLNGSKYLYSYDRRRTIEWIIAPRLLGDAAPYFEGTQIGNLLLKRLKMHSLIFPPKTK